MRFENPGNRRRSIAERKDPTFDKVPGKNVAVIDAEPVLKKEEGALVPAGDNAVATVPKNEVAIVKEPGVPAVLPEKEKEKAKEEPETITKGKKIRATIVENAAAFDSQARDTADEKMTANKAELRGVKGFLTKIWKHNLAQDYYRQKEVAKAKVAMEGRESLFEGDDDASAHKEAMGSLVKRFASEYEEAVHVDAGETRDTLDESSLTYTEVKKLIFDYAEGVITKEVFIEEKSRVLAGVINLDRQKVEKGLHHADDLLQVAEGVKRSIEHGEALNRLDVDFEIVVGRAKSGVRTEAQFNTVDRLVDKIQSTKVGRLLNETTIASSVAIAYAVSAGLSQRVASSKLAAWGSFGASALLGAGIAAARESRMIENDRRQHFREMAKGKTFDQNEASRRKEMEQFRYNTVLATECIAALNDIADEEEMTPERFRRSVHVLGDINARVHVSNEKKIDLIAYSDERLVEEERLSIDIARAEAKINLKRLAEANPGLLPAGISLEDDLKTAMEVQRTGIIEGERGVDEKNRAFSKLKKRRVAKAAAKGLATGLVIGTLAQEGISLLRDNQQGLIEGVLGKNESGQTTTALEGIRRYFAGAEFPLSGAASVETLVGGNKITLPAGVTMEAGASGMFKLMHEGKVLADGLKFENGVLSQASREALAAVGIDALVRETSVTTTETVTGSAAEMVKERTDLFGRANRVGWYDNNTPAPKFDENELRLKWGGKAGTGIDANGKVVFDVSSMTAGGSKHGAFSVNAQEAIKDGKLKMLFSLSRGSQAFAVDVPVDASGKIVIDPNSEMGKMFFEIKNGKAVFKGGFAEVVHEVGENPNGGKNYRTLSTLKGPGQETVSWERTVTKGSNSTELNLNKFAVAKDIDPPPFVPVIPRVPLERTRNPVRPERKTEVSPALKPEEAKAAVAALALAGPSIAGLIGYDEKEVVPGDYRQRLLSAVEGFKLLAGRNPSLLGFDPNMQRLLEQVKQKAENPDPALTFDEYRATVDRDLKELRRLIDASERKLLTYDPAEAEENGIEGGPLAADSRGYYSPDGEDYGLLDRKEYRSRMSEKILNNENLDLSGDDSEVVAEYLSKQSPEYLAELRTLVAGVESMSPEIETVITIPAYREGKILEKTLRNYAKLKDRSKFEIVILENHPASAERDNTKEVVDAMRSEFPDLNIRHIYKVFSAKPTIGEVRKYLVDAVMLRKQAAGITESIAVVSNDADLEDISPEYANQISSTFRNNKVVDAIGGKWDFPPQDFERFPLLHATQRLWHYMDISFRNYYLKAPELIGRNSAFRSGAYAAVGGYNKDAKLAEDLEIGWLVKEARGHRAESIKYNNAAWLKSNSRRAIVKMLSGGSLIQQYGDFHVNEDIRNADVDTLLREKKDFQVENFASQVQAIYDHYDRWKTSKGGWVDDKYINRSFNRAMRSLGVRYKMKEGRVSITDTSKLSANLAKYAENRA